MGGGGCGLCKTVCPRPSSGRQEAGGPLTACARHGRQPALPRAAGADGRLVVVGALVGGGQQARVPPRPLHLLAHPAPGGGALVVGPRVRVALDHLLAVLAPPEAVVHVVRVRLGLHHVALLGGGGGRAAAAAAAAAAPAAAAARRGRGPPLAGALVDHDLGVGALHEGGGRGEGPAAPLLAAPAPAPAAPAARLVPRRDVADRAQLLVAVKQVAQVLFALFRLVPRWRAPPPPRAQLAGGRRRRAPRRVRRRVGRDGRRHRGVARLGVEIGGGGVPVVLAAVVVAAVQELPGHPHRLVLVEVRVLLGRGALARGGGGRRRAARRQPGAPHAAAAAAPLVAGLHRGAEGGGDGDERARGLVGRGPQGGHLGGEPRAQQLERRHRALAQVVLARGGLGGRGGGGRARARLAAVAAAAAAAGRAQRDLSHGRGRGGRRLGRHRLRHLARGRGRRRGRLLGGAAALPAAAAAAGGIARRGVLGVLLRRGLLHAHLLPALVLHVVVEVEVVLAAGRGPAAAVGQRGAAVAVRAHLVGARVRVGALGDGLRDVARPRLALYDFLHPAPGVAALVVGPRVGGPLDLLLPVLAPVEAVVVGSRLAAGAVLAGGLGSQRAGHGLHVQRGGAQGEAM
jgi:hypothetical protein